MENRYSYDELMEMAEPHFIDSPVVGRYEIGDCVVTRAEWYAWRSACDVENEMNDDEEDFEENSYEVSIDDE